MSFERCKLQVQSAPSGSAPRCSSLPAAASGRLHLARRGRVTAECKHRRQIRQLAQIVRLRRSKGQPTTAQPQCTLFSASSSLGSFFADLVARYVSTRNAHSDDNVIWADRNCVPRNHSITGPRWALFVFFSAATFPTLAFSDPQQPSPPQAEVSVAQLPPGTKLHFTLRPQATAAPHSSSAAPPAALKKMAEDAANAHTLPVNYFLRLIRQESGFDPNSVSPAGAQGIAQFMPGTALTEG